MLLVALLAVAIASLWLLSSRWRSPRYNPPLPPGSFGLPLLGETLQLLQAMKANKIGGFFNSRIHKHGQTFKTHLFGSPTIVVGPTAGLKAIFYTHNKLLGSAWPTAMKTLVGERSLFFLNGDEAKSFRHILMRFLGPEGIQRYIARTSAMVQKHLEQRWLVGDELRAYDLIKEGLFLVVFDLFLSLSDAKQVEELLSPFEEVIAALLELPIDLPGTKFYKAKFARRRIFAKLDEFMAQRRVELEQGKATETQDLMSVLMTTKDEAGKVMSDDEIKQNILMLILAGHDTSASSLAVSVKCLGQYPWCYDEVLKENLAIAAAKPPGEALNISDIRKMKYTWRSIQESMRVVPPATGSMRKVNTSFELDGYTVPQGWQMLWSIYRSNKNEEIFDEPDKFDPERFNGTGPVAYGYTPFGGGSRICPGYELAKMQDLVFLHHLIVSYRWSLVDPEEVVQMAPLAKPLKGLPVRLHRNSAVPATDISVISKREGDKDQTK